MSGFFIKFDKGCQHILKRTTHLYKFQWFVHDVYEFR